VLNFIPNVCILTQTAMTGLTDMGAESVAPDAGGVVRVRSTDSAPQRAGIQEFGGWMGRPTCLP
jgi:hypothetical protein